MLVLDRLTMLVTADPVAELDAAIAYAATQREYFRARGDTDTAARLTGWIDALLDQRLAFRLASPASSTRR